VLRSFTDPFYEVQAEDWLEREAGALDLLSGTGVPAPAWSRLIRPARMASTHRSS
jgi:hypothetical protein